MTRRLTHSVFAASMIFSASGLSFLAFLNLSIFELARYCTELTFAVFDPRRFIDVSRRRTVRMIVKRGQKVCEYVNNWFPIGVIFCGYCHFFIPVYPGMCGFAVTDAYMFSFLWLTVDEGLLAYCPNCSLGLPFISP